MVMYCLLGYLARECNTTTNHIMTLRQCQSEPTRKFSIRSPIPPEVDGFFSVS